MTIKEAIAEAKELGEWSVVSHEPTSVSIFFLNDGYSPDETELDLYAEDKEAELNDLWNCLCPEMPAAPDSVIRVSAYGCIA